VGLRTLRPAQPAASAATARSEKFPFDPINPPPAEESERRFAESPAETVTGAALAIRLAMDDRADEAWIVIARMREIPGAEHDPLIDYSAAVVAGFADEFQRSLVFVDRALDAAIAQGRTDLIGTLRGSRGRTLDRLGHRDEAFAELERARIDLERTADHRPLYRALVGLAGLYYERGEVDRCEAMYRQAIETAAAGGFEPLIAHTGLAEVNLLRGRPDLAEPLARGPIEQLRKHPSPHRPADALIRLAQIVRDLGRNDEATAHLEDALSLVGPTRSPRSFAEGLFTRSRFDLEAGRLDRIDATVAELEALAVEDLSRRPIAFARSLAAQKAALSGDLATATAAFAEARRLHLSEGYRDYAALSDLALAEAEARDGDPERALRVLDEALAGFDEAASILPRFFAETIRARLDAEGGRPVEARRRLNDLGEGLADSPSLSRRIAFVAAEGAVAASEGRAPEADAALRRALDVARAAGRKVDELTLRIDLARLDARGAGAAALLDVERESAALGLHALAARARRARGRDAS
jgi:tetratricopeptide (TPR) repeat protein